MSKLKKTLLTGMSAIMVTIATSGSVMAERDNSGGVQVYNPEADIARIKSIGKEFVRFDSSDSYNLDTLYNFTKDAKSDRTLDPYTQSSMEHFKDKMREQAFIMQNLNWEYDDDLNKVREERGRLNKNNGYKEEVIDDKTIRYWTVDNYVNPKTNRIERYSISEPYANGNELLKAGKFENINDFARYVIFEGDSPKLNRFPPQWAARAIVDWLPRAQDCIVVAWADQKYPNAARKAKDAIQDIANYAVRIQINNDFLTDSLRYPVRVTQDTMIVPSQIRHEAAQLAQKLYAPYLKGINVCLSEEIRLTANAIRSCNPEHEVCDCYIEGEAGLKRLSATSFTVDNGETVRRYKAYPFTIDANINQQVCKASTMGGGFDGARSTWFHSCPDYMRDLMCHCDEPDASNYSQCLPSIMGMGGK